MWRLQAQRDCTGSFKMVQIREGCRRLGWTQEIRGKRGGKRTSPPDARPSLQPRNSLF